MAKYTWREGSVPENLKVTQVYGVIFSRDGRVLLSVDGGKYSLIGGHPEEFDGGMAATLKREVLEEVNIEIENPIMLGYQEVDEENGLPVYAQVRMAALIASVGEIRPDVDNGKTYGRLLVPPARAIELLGWGDIGYRQITAGAEAAKKIFGVDKFSEKEEYI